jgi:hypothetical protein
MSSVCSAFPTSVREQPDSGIDISTYRYMMKDFYRGGNHEQDPE